jgi:hypothetical protein
MRNLLYRRGARRSLSAPRRVAFAPASHRHVPLGPCHGHRLPSRRSPPLARGAARPPRHSAQHALRGTGVMPGMRGGTPRGRTAGVGRGRSGDGGAGATGPGLPCPRFARTPVLDRGAGPLASPARTCGGGGISIGGAVGPGSVGGGRPVRGRGRHRHDHGRPAPDGPHHGKIPRRGLLLQRPGPVRGGRAHPHPALPRRPLRRGDAAKGHRR